MLIVKKILYLLNKAELKSAYLILVMITFMAFFDILGIASILPFMTVIANPSIIETNIFFNSLFEFSMKFGVKNNTQFIFIFGALVFILLIFSLFFKALTHYYQVRFIKLRGYTIGRKLIEGYFIQPYSWFLSRHTADFAKTILSEVDQVVEFGIGSLLELISKALISITLISMIIIINPKLSLIVGSLFSFTYLLIFLYFKNNLSRIGEKRLLNNELRYSTVNEAFSAIKEIKVGGLEKTYIKSFKGSAKNFANTQALSDIISQIPRFIIEAIAFGGVILMILILIYQKGSFNDAMPFISLYVFAGYRLLPSLHSIYATLSNLAYVGPSLNKLINDFKSFNSINAYTNKNILTLKKEISLVNVHYNYPNSQRSSVKNITLNIPIRSTVGIVGVTGSGKTTIVDIILGLLEPQLGSLNVDGKKINKENVRSWQQNIGYVPQHIYLSDDTIAANIAFGVKTENIDLNLVYKTSKIACLHSFVMDELDSKYQTKIGERGVRLSGGQRQRIGIARALYHNPNILILDEATSALDYHTEEKVMSSIYELSNKITIILIAHRLETVKNCNKIFLFSEGELKDQGTFSELKNKQNFFNNKVDT